METKTIRTKKINKKQAVIISGLENEIEITRKAFIEKFAEEFISDFKLHFSQIDYFDNAVFECVIGAMNNFYKTAEFNFKNPFDKSIKNYLIKNCPPFSCRKHFQKFVKFANQYAFVNSKDEEEIYFNAKCNFNAYKNELIKNKIKIC